MIPDPHDAPQNDPYAYWCPRCWRFVLDCTHLAWPPGGEARATEGLAVPLRGIRPKAENPGTRSQHRCRLSAPRGAPGSRIGNRESRKPGRILQAIDRWEVSVRSGANLTSVSLDAGAGVGGFAAGMNG